jgi:cytochrome c-type biogenesis protein CcmH/NrfG
MVAAALACVATPLLRNGREGAGTDAPARSIRTAVIWLLALPLAAGGTYALVSNYPWQNPAALAAPPPGAADASIEQMIAQLEQRLAQSPNEVDGWRLLGRSYLMTNQPRRAVQAYEKAYELGGRRDLDTGLDLAEAMLLADDPALVARAKEIIDGSLVSNPVNAKALWYSGVIALNTNDVATAKVRWTALLQQNPPPEIRDILTRQLAQLGAAGRRNGRWRPPGRWRRRGRACGTYDRRGRRSRPRFAREGAGGHDAVRVGASAGHSGAAARGRAYVRATVARDPDVERCKCNDCRPQPVLRWMMSKSRPALRSAARPSRRPAICSAAPCKSAVKPAGWA